jgi:hypothetical protein
MRHAALIREARAEHQRRDRLPPGAAARAWRALVTHIALINAFNRINVTTRQIAGKLR